MCSSHLFRRSFFLEEGHSFQQVAEACQCPFVPPPPSSLELRLHPVSVGAQKAEDSPGSAPRGESAVFAGAVGTQIQSGWMSSPGLKEETVGKTLQGSKVVRNEVRLKRSFSPPSEVLAGPSGAERRSRTSAARTGKETFWREALDWKR